MFRQCVGGAYGGTCDSTELMRRVMTTPPEWAAGLPLDIGIKTMERYGK